MPEETTEQRHARYHREHFASFEEVASREELKVVADVNSEFRKWYYRTQLAGFAGLVVILASGMITAWGVGKSYAQDKASVEKSVQKVESAVDKNTEELDERQQAVESIPVIRAEQTHIKEKVDTIDRRIEYLVNEMARQGAIRAPPPEVTNGDTPE